MRTSSGCARPQGTHSRDGKSIFMTRESSPRSGRKEFSSDSGKRCPWGVHKIHWNHVFLFNSQPERHSDGGYGGCQGNEPVSEKMSSARGNWDGALHDEDVQGVQEIQLPTGVSGPPTAEGVRVSALLHAHAAHLLHPEVHPWLRKARGQCEHQL